MDDLEEIMDSTAEVENACMPSSFTCINNGCGKQCATNDEGVNPFMKYCNACNIILHAELDQQNYDTIDHDTENNIEALSVAVLDSPLPLHTSSSQHIADIAPENSESMSLNDISQALTSLVGTNDKRQQVAINYGDIKKNFHYAVDCIGNFSKAKKLFFEENLPVLYWWEVYTAMQTPAKGNKVFVCPCRIVGTDYVLAYILKTRCNRPHYDCLVYDVVEGSALVIKQADKWELNYDCDVDLCDYDVADFERGVNDWIKLGRWEYKPERGLRLECRKPQLADTELKNLGYGEISNAASSPLFDLGKRLSIPVSQFGADTTSESEYSSSRKKLIRTGSKKRRIKQPAERAIDSDDDFSQPTSSSTISTRSIASVSKLDSKKEESDDVRRLKAELEELKQMLMTQSNAMAITGPTSQMVPTFVPPPEPIAPILKEPLTVPVVQYNANNYENSTAGLFLTQPTSHVPASTYCPISNWLPPPYQRGNHNMPTMLDHFQSSIDHRTEMDIKEYEIMQIYKGRKRAEADLQKQQANALIAWITANR